MGGRGYVFSYSEFQIWSFHVLRGNSFPSWYLTQFYVVCCHFIMFHATVSRSCRLSEFYPNRASFNSYTRALYLSNRKRFPHLHSLI